MFKRLCLLGLVLSFSVYADLNSLKQAYPDHVRSVFDDKIVWTDGTVMPTREGKAHKTLQEVLDHPALIDQVSGPAYGVGTPEDFKHYTPQNDPGRVRYEPFFKKMYGATSEAVENHLVTIYWMPALFGSQYPLRVTTINGVDKKFMTVSRALEALVKIHPAYSRFLEKPAGTFEWRTIANTHRLSLHSFGMTLDLNESTADYWQWALQSEKRPISETASLVYHNQIPWEIVRIFEENGFIWGGKWHHYDTQHFEYRPELLLGCACQKQ